MADFSSLNDRLNNLEKRIAAARDRLYLHETPHSDHATALDELTERYFYLQQELNSETANLEAEGVHVDSFEKTVLDWINSLTFNH
ncbi:MAG TPA: hypothetical protein VHQ92_03735 [Pseudolabrys sp.]|nr:hypothetical protein [Pseudolabrys sp.]